jgi:amphi-Trp domain-containing protein
MSSHKQEVSLKTKAELGQVINYLKEVVGCLEAGTLCLQNGSHGIVLKPGQTVEVDMGGSQKGDKEGFHLKVSWLRTETADEEPHLTITSDEAAIDQEEQVAAESSAES